MTIDHLQNGFYWNVVQRLVLTIYDLHFSISPYYFVALCQRFLYDGWMDRWLTIQFAFCTKFLIVGLLKFVTNKLTFTKTQCVC